MKVLFRYQRMRALRVFAMSVFMKLRWWNMPNKAFVSLKRETSKYNKYMKWHVEYFRDDMSPLASQWYKTQTQAEQAIETSIWKGQKGFHIGNRISYTEYHRI
jgi:hypothetical protein